MKIEMTRHELSLVLELVSNYANWLYEAIRKRKEFGADPTLLENRLDEIDLIRRKLWREFVEN